MVNTFSILVVKPERYIMQRRENSLERKRRETGYEGRD
jgi:hypothetical protein